MFLIDHWSRKRHPPPPNVVHIPAMPDARRWRGPAGRNHWEAENQVIIDYEVRERRQFHQTLAGAGFAAIMASNSYLDRHAQEFEKQFRAFSKRKRIALDLGAIGIMVVTGIAFAIVGTEYREMFPPAGRND
jgi:hypothetical protein